MVNIVLPSVKVIGYTWARHDNMDMLPDPAAFAMEHIAEFAGRACYQSFDKPNPLTARNWDYLENIISLGHESVLEHNPVTFYITGVSRAFTHELIRHRLLSYSQQSQRYVDESEANIVIPPAITDPDMREAFCCHMEACLFQYHTTV